MFHRVCRHLDASTLIAVLALVFAVTGGAFAATGAGKGDGGAGAHSLSARAAKSRRGPRGPQGPAGQAGPAGKEGKQGPAGPAGAKGETGATGASGATGAAGAGVTTATFKTEKGGCKEGGVELFSASGTSYVCNGEESTPGQPGIQGIQGIPGVQGIPGTNGKGVVTGEFEGTHEPTSPVDNPCKGAGGSSIEVEGSGKPTYACNGKGGSGGGEGLPATLPEGKTETGAIFLTGQVPAMSEGFNEPAVSISFPIPLAKALGRSEVHSVGSTGNGTTCPGTVEKPAAEPGFLCIYEGAIEKEPAGTENLSFVGATVPPGRKNEEIVFGTGTSGTVVHAVYEGPNAGTISIQGSWAVTAPKEP
jgi:hypothetical protein